MKKIKTFESFINEGKDCQNCEMEEGEKYARKCSHCDGGMNSGYVSDNGEYACSDECLYVDGYTREQLNKDYEEDLIYWTEWEDEDDFQYIVKDGELKEIEE